MKILRSVNRRGFRIESAGWFNVLRSNTWFPASRLPGGFRYRVGQSKETASPQAHENSTENSTAELTSMPEQKALGHADSQESAIRLQIMQPNTDDHRLMRPALIVLAAIAITYILLWWIGNP